MALFKCKMCGGTLEITNETVAICEYCGTQQTLPRLDNDRRTNLYDRANHFRRNNEFDKAMGIYEQILNEDGSDCEAYWSLVLCRYGIEYVEDPATHKRIPTVNRAQFTSVFDDDNYKSAIQNADAVQRAVYEEEARNINEIQKGILAISQKEEPFDIFICYKETDNNGRRTPDSVLATELYHQLIREGFKVFFSRITLEDKLGSAYEPYIFAALNSAKVMVVLGTKPEYFKAVWVRNEWSRYLSLIKQGHRKMLIPAYKDMDPYDLPDEFSHLQAQDMSKLGFMQDLIHGISKIVKAEKTAAVVQETVTINPGIAPLLKRAFMFLEDGDWSSADEYCEKVLDADPECAQAYLGKLLAELRVKKQELLVNQAELFDSRNNFLKAIRFGDEELRNTLNDYIDQIKARKEKTRLYSIYKDAKEKMAAARSQRQCIEAANVFESISAYSDAAILAAQCREKAEIIGKNIAYDQAYNLLNRSEPSVGACERAIHLFEQIPDWKDSRQQIELCRKKIKELKDKAEADRLEKLRQEELARQEQAQFQKRFKKLVIISALAIVVILGFLILLGTVIIPDSKYNAAVKLMEAGDYKNAMFAFQVLDGYRDSEDKIKECLDAMGDDQYNDTTSEKNDILQSEYDNAIMLMNASKYTEAIAAFEACNGYKDSLNKIEECYALLYGEDKWNVIKNVNVGDIYTFGTYEQDNVESNGKENIEWMVLAKDGSKILVISKYALDCKPFNDEYTLKTWDNCTVRKWLNMQFLNSAFSDTEQMMIPSVNVSADTNPSYSTYPAETTNDKIFLLSIIEAYQYFQTDSMRQCKPTEYAVYNGADCETGNCCWLLRTLGGNSRLASFVAESGMVDESGHHIDYGGYAIRPAMWIDLAA